MQLEPKLEDYEELLYSEHEEVECWHCMTVSHKSTHYVRFIKAPPGWNETSIGTVHKNISYYRNCLCVQGFPKYKKRCTRCHSPRLGVKDGKVVCFKCLGIPKIEVEFKQPKKRRCRRCEEVFDVFKTVHADDKIGSPWCVNCMVEAGIIKTKD